MTPAKRGSFDLRITREFNVSPEVVFEQWSDPEYVGYWFAPTGYAVSSCDFTPSPGASWRVEYSSEKDSCIEFGEFLEVQPPHRLVLSLTQHGSDGVTVSDTIIVVTFEAIQGGTRMDFHQTGFETAQRRDDHVMGWGQCFDKLRDSLSASCLS